MQGQVLIMRKENLQLYILIFISFSQRLEKCYKRAVVCLIPGILLPVRKLHVSDVQLHKKKKDYFSVIFSSEVCMSAYTVKCCWPALLFHLMKMIVHISFKGSWQIGHLHEPTRCPGGITIPQLWTFSSCSQEKQVVFCEHHFPHLVSL